MSEVPENLDPKPVAESESDLNATVRKASWIMGGSLLLSRILGVVRDAIMTGMFGSNASTDAYTLAFQVPDTLFYLISGGALSSAFIPVFSEYWHTNRQKEAWKVFSTIVTVMSVVVIGFLLLAGVYAADISRFASRGKIGTASFDDIVFMSRILLPSQFAFFIGGVMMGTLYARKMFAIPGLGPNIYNIGIILGAVLISHFIQPGIAGMCIGATAGAIVGNLVVPYLAIRKMGFEFQPSFDVKHEGVKKVFRLMLPVVLGLSLPGVFAMIMRYYASFYPDGTNSILDYGNKLMQAPLAIIGQSMAIAIFPVLTQHFSQNRMDLFRTQVEKTTKTVLYLSVPASVLLAILAPQICASIYLHGKFTAEDCARTAQVLQVFCIGIWAWCLHPVLMRTFYSLQDTLTPIIIGTLTTGVFVGLIIAFQPLFGYLALPLAGSVAPMIMVLAMALTVSPRIGGLPLGGIATTLGKSVLGTVGIVIVGGLVAWSPIASWVAGAKIPTLIATLLGFVGSLWAYYFVTKKLKMPESEYLDRAFSRIQRRR